MADEVTNETTTEQSVPVTTVEDLQKMIDAEVKTTYHVPDEKAEAEPTEIAKEPESATPEIPDDVFAEARKFGISRSQVKTMGVEQTKSMIERFKPVDETPKDDAPKDDAKPDDPAKPSQFAFENEDSLDPDTRANIKRLHEHYSQEIAKRDKNLEKLAGRLNALEQGHGQVSQFFEQQQAQQRAEAQRQLKAWYDTRFEEAGDDWQEVFGKGKIDSLKPDSEQFKNRMRVIEVAHALAMQFHEAGRPVPDNVFKVALLGEFEDYDTRIKQRKQAERVKRASDGRFISEPSASGKASDNGSGETFDRDAAIRKLAKTTGLNPGL